VFPESADGASSMTPAARQKLSKPVKVSRQWETTEDSRRAEATALETEACQGINLNFLKKCEIISLLLKAHRPRPSGVGVQPGQTWNETRGR